ncbi:MAG: hypothetical protein ACREJO_05635 [Phycisphaerales bacterium]
MADRPATTIRKKPGRKRRVAGWALLAIGVLITGVWGASRWWWYRGYSSDYTYSLCYGKALVDYDRGLSRVASGWRVLKNADPKWSWQLSDRTSVASYKAIKVSSFDLAPFGCYYAFRDAPSQPVFSADVEIMLWPFPLLVWGGGGWLVWSGRRARRRAMTGLCGKCGYDLAGWRRGARARSVGSRRSRPTDKLSACAGGDHNAHD